MSEHVDGHGPECAICDAWTAQPIDECPQYVIDHWDGLSRRPELGSVLTPGVIKARSWLIDRDIVQVKPTQTDRYHPERKD